MSILALLIWIVVLGVVGYLVVNYVPMAPPFPNLVIVVLVLIALLLIAHAFGLFDSLNQPVPRVR